MRASSVLFIALRRKSCEFALTEPLHHPQPQPKQSGRLLALDLGTKRVGVAVSDELRLTVRPVTILGAAKLETSVE
jgi:hypothetical protein